MVPVVLPEIYNLLIAPASPLKVKLRSVQVFSTCAQVMCFPFCCINIHVDDAHRNYNSTSIICPNRLIIGTSINGSPG